MTVRVAINGFGRIGRLVLRSIVEFARRDIEVVAINDLGPVETNAHLLRYDSVHGRFPGVVEVDGDTIDVGLGPIKVTAIRNPAELPHKDLGVDVALECTGLFTAKEKASAHLAAGARRVLVSAPCDSADKHHRVRRQPPGADGGRSGGLQRLVHHQLPGAGLSSVLLDIGRHRARLHDHRSRLHQRPAHAGYAALRPLPGAGRGDVDDPDLHRRGEGDRPRHPRAGRQARRRRRSACRRRTSRWSTWWSRQAAPPRKTRSTPPSRKPPARRRCAGCWR